MSEIRKSDDYPGFKLKLYADFEQIHELVLIDVTTGDAITPHEIKFRVPRLFLDDKLELLSYTLETILAEKVETILSRSASSTRPRDYYDVYTLSKLRWNTIEFDTLKVALDNTMKKRESKFSLSDYPIIIQTSINSDVQKGLWDKYQRQYLYAKDITFEEVIDALKTIVEQVIK